MDGCTNLSIYEKRKCFEFESHVYVFNSGKRKRNGKWRGIHTHVLMKLNVWDIGKVWTYTCTHDLNHMGPERVCIHAYTSELII